MKRYLTSLKTEVEVKTREWYSPHVILAEIQQNSITLCWKGMRKNASVYTVDGTVD